MIDGGGAGQMGDKFEGGGVLSALGNLVASPYGSQDEERREARMAFYGSDNIGGPPMADTPTRRHCGRRRSCARSPSHAARALRHEPTSGLHANSAVTA